MYRCVYRVDCSDCIWVVFAFSECCGDVLQIEQLYLYSNFSFKNIYIPALRWWCLLVGCADAEITPHHRSVCFLLHVHGIHGGWRNQKGKSKRKKSQAYVERDAAARTWCSSRNYLCKHGKNKPTSTCIKKSAEHIEIIQKFRCMRQMQTLSSSLCEEGWSRCTPVHTLCLLRFSCITMKRSRLLSLCVCARSARGRTTMQQCTETNEIWNWEEYLENAAAAAASVAMAETAVLITIIRILCNDDTGKWWKQISNWGPVDRALARVCVYVCVRWCNLNFKHIAFALCWLSFVYKLERKIVGKSQHYSNLTRSYCLILPTNLLAHFKQ